MCTYVVICECDSVNIVVTEQTKTNSLGSRICAGVNMIQGCEVPLLLAEREVPLAADKGQ